MGRVLERGLGYGSSVECVEGGCREGLQGVLGFESGVFREGVARFHGLGLRT